MFADSRKWIQSGWVDYLTPQVYWYLGQTGSDYKLLVPWWNDNAFGRHVYVGLADYKMNTAGWTDPAQIRNQIGLNRAHANVYGQIHFRHAFLAANPLNYRTDLQQNVYNRPALLPAMPWKDSLPVPAPSALAAAPAAQNAVQLTWSPAAASNDETEKTRRFAIYRSDQRAMDIEASANLLALTTTDETSFTDTGVADGKYYFYTVTALNRLHHESAPANTVSNDLAPPEVRTRDVSVTLAGGSAAIAAADIDNGSIDNWGIESLSVDRSSFSCADIGAQRVVLTATDKAGNTASAGAIVNVLGRVPQPVIGVSRADGTETGLPANAIALGYGAQSVTLTATDGGAAGGNSYAWSPAAGLSTTSGALTSFTPAAAGSYTFTLQAASENACLAAASVTVSVIDARCENDKVQVCHQTGSAKKPARGLCIAPGAVGAHLRKGDTLGACTP